MDRIAAELGRHSARVLGTFSPKSYCIGLGVDPKEFRVDVMPYPIDASNPDAISEFGHTLTAFHEINHHLAFTSSNFGLDCARALNMAYRSFLRGSFWPESPRKSFAPEQSEYISRFLDFYYYYHWDLVPRTFEIKDNLEGGSGFYSRPFHVKLLWEGMSGVEDYWANRRRIADAELSVQALTLYRHDAKTSVHCNSAAIFEGLAVALEMQHLSLAFPERFGSIPGILGYVDSLHPVYQVCVRAYLTHFELPINYFSLHLAAIIDISLMYSPGTVNHIAPSAGLSHAANERFFSTFDTFLHACDAAQAVRPISIKLDYDDIERYQNDICAVMGIPTVAQLCALGLDALKKLNVSEKTADNIIKNHIAGHLHPLDWSALPLIDHLSGLLERGGFGSGFINELSNSRNLIRVLNDRYKYLTVFDIVNKNPLSIILPHMTKSVIGGMISRFIEGTGHTCPLKDGDPYLCPSHSDDSDVYCAGSKEFFPGYKCPYFALKI